MTERGSSAVAQRIGVFTVIFIFAFLLHNFLSEPAGQVLEPKSHFTSTWKETVQDATKVKLVTEYLKCGHSVTEEDRVTADQLALLLEDSSDVRVEEQGNVKVLVFTDPGFCPQDEQKRYMGTFGDYLTVFKGPAGSGEIEMITKIRVEQLPEYWQQELMKGKLVFQDQVSLLEALDSLDEYQRERP